MSDTVRVFAPGRIEIAGNHTDHQGGKTVSATVDKGITMTLRANGGTEARVESTGFGTSIVDLSSLAPHPEESRTTAALIRGVASCLKERSIAVGGFDVQVESSIAAGGGLSSSAAFELALAKGLDTLFGEGALTPAELAAIGQRAEVEWFGKPCGLQDQTVIANGGIVALDFRDASKPTVSPIDFDFAAAGLSVIVIDTGSDHTGGTDDFAQLVKDMARCAQAFGAERLCEVDDHELVTHIPELRNTLGDRAALRALHWINESHLVQRRIDALCTGDMDTFLRETRYSAASSAQLLQNVSASQSDSQPAMVALALAETALAERGAVRIHGGGFGGTIIAFVPDEAVGGFISAMDRWLFPGCCEQVRIRKEGVSATWM